MNLAHRTFLAFGLAVAGLVLGLVPTTAQGAGLYPDRPDLFPIGVWQQATTNFDTWKARGINTLVQVPGGHEKERTYWSNWHTQAVQKGFEIIRKPDPNMTIARDIKRGNLRALSLVDEPDYTDYSASALQSDYNRIKKASPNMPVFVNYSGGVVLGAQRTRNGTSTSAVPYGSYLNATDWVSSDIYPVTGWNRPDWIDYGAASADGKKNPGTSIDRLRTLAPAKPQWAIIETSDQNLSWVPGGRGVHAAEFRGQLWHSIIHGAKGVTYFPLELGSTFRFDATPAAVANEMLTQHPRIQQVARVLNNNWKPAGTKGHTEPTEDLGFASSDARIEASWHHHTDGDYFMVLNMSSTPGTYNFNVRGVAGLAKVVGEGRTVQPSGDVLSDSFDPWETHVYKFANTAAPCEIDCAPLAAPAVFASIPAVPEPSCIALLFGAALVAFRRNRKR